MNRGKMAKQVSKPPMKKDAKKPAKKGYACGGKVKKRG